MGFTRFRTRGAALAALGVLALAAVLVGGCAAPDSDERATFGSVVGVVQDTQGRPIEGATVRLVQVGQPNLPGAAVPTAVTDASGRFVLPAVQVSPRLLIVRAEAPGFLAGVGRRVQAGGTPVTQFAVTTTGATTVTVVLQGENEGLLASGTIGPAGGTVGSLAANGISIAFPANAVTSATNIRVFRLLGVAIPVPVTNLGRQATPGTETLSVPVAAWRIEPSGLSLGVPATVTAQLPVPLATAPLWRLDPDANAWVDAGYATLSSGGTVATFQVDSLGIYMISLQTVWTFGTPAPAATNPFPELTHGAQVIDGKTVVNAPPLTSGQGYTIALPVRLSVSGVSGPAAQLVKDAFAAIVGQVADGFVREAVPGAGVGLECTLSAQDVQVLFTLATGDQTATGTRYFWDCRQVTTIPPAPEFPHFQGHAQGGGGGGA